MEPLARATIGRSTNTDWTVVSLQGHLTIRSRTKTVTPPSSITSIPVVQPYKPSLVSVPSCHHLTYQPSTFTLSRQHTTLSSGVWACFASVIPDICHLHRLWPLFLYVLLSCEARYGRWARGHTAGWKCCNATSKGTIHLGSRYTASRCSQAAEQNEQHSVP